MRAHTSMPGPSKEPASTVDLAGRRGPVGPERSRPCAPHWNQAEPSWDSEPDAPVFAHVDGWSAMNHPLFPPAPVPVAPPPPVAVQAKSMKAIIEQCRELPRPHVNTLDRLVLSSGRRDVKKNAPPPAGGVRTETVWDPHFTNGQNGHQIALPVKSSGDFGSVEGAKSTLTHELGHSVASSILALAKDRTTGNATVALQKGNSFAQKYLGWREDGETEVLKHMWTLGDAEPVPLTVGQTQVQATGKDVKS